MRKSIGTAVLAVLLATAGNANADTNLVVNGGFESQAFTGWAQSGQTSGTGVVSSGVGGYTAHSGNFYVVLGAFNSLDFLSQAITTIPGDQYQVSFWLISNLKGSTINEFGATFDGQTLFPLTTNIPSLPWTQYTYNVTATGTSAALTFSSLDNLGLDDVSVVDEGAAVPLPASVYGGGALLGVLGILAYRRRAGAAA